MNILVTHKLFDLCLFEHFSPVPNFGYQSLAEIKPGHLLFADLSGDRIKFCVVIGDHRQDSRKFQYALIRNNRSK